MTTSPYDGLDQVLALLDELARETAIGEYLFRGEPRHYAKVSSGLFRHYESLESMSFDIGVVQSEILEQAKRYTLEENDLEILAAIQHFGGRTNLIDFTSDLLIALFFACDGHPQVDGRIILLRVSDDISDCIRRPRNPVNRILAQKSIFVQPPKGYIEDGNMVVINVPHDIKASILRFLQTRHGISSHAIYNDLHGFIRFQDLHESSYAAFSAGMTHGSRGKQAKAIESYTKALELNQQFAPAYNNRGTAYIDSKQYDLAIDDFDKAIEIDAKLSAAYFNRAIAYRHKGELERAMEDLDNAIVLDPGFAKAYSDRGNLHLDDGKYNRAMQDYNKALSLDPNEPKAYLNRGNAFLHLEEYEKAIDDYDYAITLAPNYAEAYCNRASAFVEMGEFSSAIEDCNKTLDLGFERGRVYYLRGIAWLGLSNWSDGKKDLNIARNNGVDISKVFCERWKHVGKFEKIFNIKIPEEVAKMLDSTTEQNDD